MFKRTNLAPEETAARRADGYVLVTVGRDEFWAKGDLTAGLIQAQIGQSNYQVYLEHEEEDEPVDFSHGVRAREGQRFYVVPSATY